MTKNNRIMTSVLIISLATLACNLPGGAAAPTFTPVAAEAASPTPTPTPAAAVACSPIITTNTDANVRSGPGQVYNILGQIPQGGIAPVAGKNFDGTWWYIEFAGGPGGYGWVAGSITTATCIPAALAVIAAPPTPVIPPTNTSVPSNTPVPGAPPSATPTFGLIIILPPIFIIPSATPTLFFIIPVIPTIPCFFC